MRPEMLLRVEVAIAAILPLLVLGFLPTLAALRRYAPQLIVAAFVLYGVLFTGLAIFLRPGPDKPQVMWAEVLCGLLLVLQATGLMARKQIEDHPADGNAARLARRARISGTLIRVILLVAIVAVLLRRA